jgi:hypothetical protein
MNLSPLSFVMSEADVNEMIRDLGDETVPVKRTSKAKFFWLPQKCAKTRKLLWFKSGYEVDVTWSDGRGFWSQAAGLKKGQLSVFIGGRGIGKSLFTRSGLLKKPNPAAIVNQIVDDLPWKPVMRHTKMYYCNEAFIFDALRDFK